MKPCLKWRAGDQAHANPLTRVVLMSHETFHAEQRILHQLPFKHVVLDMSNSRSDVHSLEHAQALSHKPSVLLLTSETIIRTTESYYYFQAPY